MAAGSKVDSLFVQFGSDFKELLSEMKKAEAATAKFRGTVHKELSAANQFLDKFSSAARAAVLGFASAFSAAKIGRIVGDTVEWADALKTTADRIGLNTDQLQELQAAGRDVGLGVAETTKGLEAFSGRLAEALSGKGEGAPLLKQLGITARETLPALQQIADKIREFDRPSQIAIARTLFGEGDALKFLDLLTRGSAGIDQLMRNARETGRVIDRELIAKAAELNQEWQRVGDVGMAAARRQTLEIVTGLTDILRLAKDIGPAVDEWTNRLTRFNPVIQGFKALFDAQGEIRKKMAEQTGGVGRIAQKAVPGLQQAITTGTRRYTAPAAGGAESELDRLLRRVAEEAAVARAALEQGPRGQAWARIADDLKRLHANTDQAKKAALDFAAAWRDRGLAALRDVREENEDAARMLEAEIAGRKDLLIQIQIEAQLRRQFGREFVEQNRAEIEGLARARAAIEKKTETARAWAAEMRAAGDTIRAGIVDSVLAPLDRAKSAAEQLREIWARVFDSMSRRLLDFALDQAWQMIFDNMRGTGRGGAGLLGGLFGGAGGNDWLEILKGLPIIGGLFAEGGRPPVGVPSIVGERGPELFVPDTAGTIIPNRAIGGGTIHLHGAPDSTVRLAQVEAMLNQLGHRVVRVDRSIEERAIAANIDARRRGGIAAAY